MDIHRLYDAIRDQVVGREDETQLVLAALGAGRDLLLEGPPGTSKSTLLRAITAANGTTLRFVEGNADLTPAKLVGHHSPSRVLQEDYGPENFVYGPLPLAMRDGGLLYIEEFNRVPEDTLNTLITAMAERELTVPRVGTIGAASGFRVVAAMNPFDNIGTARLSGAVVDRLCRVRMDYQPEAEEWDIVTRRTGSDDAWLVRLAVRAARRTREHPDLRMGASVRAAIDFVLVTERLAELRHTTLFKASDDAVARRTLVAAAQTSFSIKIVVREASRRSADDIVAEIVLAALDPSKPPDGPREPRPRSDVAGDEAAPKDREPNEKSGRTGGASAKLESPGHPFSGQTYIGDEAYRTATRGAVAQGMYRTFAAKHPRLAERLHRGAPDPAELEAALGDEPAGALEALGELADLYDRADLRALARRLARELILRAARRDVAGRSSRGRLTSMQYRGEAADLDLERSLEHALLAPRPADEDLFVLDRRHRQRAYALILDTSGSMKGPAIFHAALALASFAVRVVPDPFAVVAFWREAAVLKRLHEDVPLDTLLDRVLSLPGRGLTDIGLGLQAGLDELEAAGAQERTGLLFSDGLQTAGAPAEPVAASFPLLHVVATGQSAESISRCRHLAALGGGRCAAIEGVASIPAAVNHCLAA